MRKTILTTGLLVLAACGKSSEPVGENSAGSVRTTAVGTIVATEPSATPTPPTGDGNAVAGTADNAM